MTANAMNFSIRPICATGRPFSSPEVGRAAAEGRARAVARGVKLGRGFALMPKQMEKLASQPDRVPPESEPARDASPSDAWWNSVLSDPRAAGKPWLPIQQRRLSEIPRHLLRVECLRCNRHRGDSAG
jgi:hypothetical protein